MSTPIRYHATPGPKKEGSYIVMLKERKDKGPILGWLDEDYEKEPDVNISHRYNECQLINAFAANLSETALADTLARDDVEAVYDDAMATLDGVKSSTQNQAPWGLHRVSHQGPAQHPFKYVYPENAGAGVNIYIIDTGIYIEHREFEGRATYGKTFLQPDLVGAGEDPYDKHGHGTHVAGTAISKAWGVAKKANAIAVKVISDDGKSFASDVIAGIDWVVAQFEANRSIPSIINMSLGFDTLPPLDLAVNAAFERGVRVVVSAGNTGIDAALRSPAGAKRAFTVGAIELNTDKRPDWSNFGSVVNVYAPGTGITSAGIGEDDYTYMDGTSHSAPHVAGIFAIAMSVDPGDPSENSPLDKSQDNLPVIQMITL